VFSYINAEKSEVYGIEFEGLKSLGFLSNGGWSDAFYLAGNVTLSDSEVNIPESSAAQPTNFTRRLTQHSEWVANVQLGYDSFNGMHGATLVYNAFGERIFFAGIRGFDDAYEQPFHSLDFVYSFYPTQNLSMKLRLQNLLDDKTTIEQDGVKILEQTVGLTFLFDIKYQL
jgi:outer membrane receptor protein involved in Fe transport